MIVLTDQVLFVSDALIAAGRWCEEGEELRPALPLGEELLRVACLCCGSVCRASGVVADGDDRVKCQRCGSSKVAVEYGEGALDEYIRELESRTQCPHCLWLRCLADKYCGGCGRLVVQTTREEASS